MNRASWFFAVAVALMTVAAVLLVAHAGVRQTRLKAPIERLSPTLGRFTAVDDAPDNLLPSDARPHDRLVRFYRSGADTVWLALDFYPAQTEHARPPTADLVHPLRGWAALNDGHVSIPLGSGTASALDANLVIMRAPGRALALVYWYQLGARSVASDYSYRASLLQRRLLHHRSDGALVRAATPVADGVEQSVAVATLAEFVRVLHAELVGLLPG